MSSVEAKHSSSSEDKPSKIGKKGPVGKSGGDGKRKKKIKSKHMTVDEAADAIPNLTVARIGRRVQVKRIDAASRTQMKNEIVHVLQVMLQCCHMADDEGKNMILMRHVAAQCQEKYPYLMGSVFTRNKTFEEPSQESDSDSDDDRSSRHRRDKKASRHSKRKSRRSKSKSKPRSKSKGPKPVKKDPVPEVVEDEQSGAD